MYPKLHINKNVKVVPDSEAEKYKQLKEEVGKALTEFTQKVNNIFAKYNP